MDKCEESSAGVPVRNARPAKENTVVDSPCCQAWGSSGIVPESSSAAQDLAGRL